ncbi:PREDICTED: uncharacterized protein LOC109174249 [Ipomoea nil]|uniref:uncharacterized protein LOC109174249 n=1 Tax=Ipomoea nil TaxID=35883 RepID=UPI0009019F1C|nr:PREDICTED: uncharacterized protein LOC109174249 [Ipomoea nil]
MGDIPWDSHEKYQYFFTKLNRKSKSASRFERTRTVGKRRGTWHGQDKGKSIIHKGTGVALGYKRCFLYRNKEEPEQDRKWLLKEFYLNDAAIMKATEKYPVLEHTKDFVVCRLQRKKSADDKPQEIKDVPIEKIWQILMGIPLDDSTATETLPPPPPTEEILAQPAGVVQQSMQGENNNGGCDDNNDDDDDMGILNEDPELVAIQQRLLEELFIV